MHNFFATSAVQTFRNYKVMAEKALAQVDDAVLYNTLDEVNNSLAVNITHMAGNMKSRFTNFLTEDGEKSWRDRDAEFETRPLSRQQLMDVWEDGWAAVFATLEKLGDDDLNRTVFIRNQPHTVIEAVHRQLTHYAYHTGQIVLLCKHFKNTGWQTLSIPKNGSEKFNDKMKSSA